MMLMFVYLDKVGQRDLNNISINSSVKSIKKFMCITCRE